MPESRQNGRRLWEIRTRSAGLRQPQRAAQGEVTRRIDRNEWGERITAIWRFAVSSVSDLSSLVSSTHTKGERGGEQYQHHARGFGHQGDIQLIKLSDVLRA
jgi:hypothetical protein